MLLDKVVIGNSIESALFAFLSESYYLPTCPNGPIFYREMEENLFGNLREDFSWSRIQICLSLSGRLLNYENLQGIKLEGDFLKIFSTEPTRKYLFGECVIFETDKVAVENRIRKAGAESFISYDDFEISNLGGRHHWLEPRISDDFLARRIYYYTSDRVPGANYVTDCVAETHLSSGQKDSFDLSHSMVRFAIERHLGDIGVKGNFMNFYKNGKEKFRKPKVIHKKRILKRVDNNEYEDCQKVKFKKMKIQEILNEFSS